MSLWNTILQGDLPKRIIVRIIFPLLTGVFLLCLFLAFLCYPPQYEYNWTNSMISRLGWPNENPVGLVFFSVGFVVYGIGALMTIPYAYRRFSAVLNRCSSLLVLLLITGFIALSLIGLIPNYPDPIFMQIHGINAVVIFAVFYILGLLISLILIRNLLSSSKIIDSRIAVFYILIAFYGFISTMVLIIVMPQGLSGHYQQDPSLPFYLSPPFYEWQAFMAILASIYLMFLLLPETS